MAKQDIEKTVLDYMNSGFHCAEAVCQVILECYGKGEYPSAPQAATAFGGGMGKTHLDTCGALSGGVLALGLLLGRDDPKADWGQTHEPTGQLRSLFVEKVGSTQCPEILMSFGPGETVGKCRQLSADTAVLLGGILDKIQLSQAGDGGESIA